MQTKGVIHELPKGMIKWYYFEDGNILCVQGGMDADECFLDVLVETGLSVDSISVDEDISNNVKYRYIVFATGALECSSNPTEFLVQLKEHLTSDGKVLMSVHNRLGIRYFCGDRDVFTNRNFDGIDNYTTVGGLKNHMKGHAYSKAEYEQILQEAGLVNHRFYSVFPGLERPQALYAEDYLPEEELKVRIDPQYYSPDTVFLYEENLYQTLIDNGMFHTMANGYLIECSISGELANANQVTVSMDRGAENAMATIIRRDDKVEKRALYPEGIRKLDCLMENTDDLLRHGVNMVHARLEGNSFVMPYVHAETMMEYLERIISEDEELFLSELDRLWQIILNSSEHLPYEEVDWEHFDPYWDKRKADDPNKDKWRKVAFGTAKEQENLGVILKKGYIDLICLNGFHVDGEFVFYDQEFYKENCPAKVILWRTIDLIYKGNIDRELCMSQHDVYERYGICEYEALWNEFSGRFMVDLRKMDELASYHQRCRRDGLVVNANRFRINYSENEYERLFKDIFKGTEGRKLYLFGSGNYTKHFLEWYDKDYEIEGILDNNQEKWNTELEGYKIVSPSVLDNMRDDTYKVIICVKQYSAIMTQLEKMGVRNYSIYDINMTYPRKPKVVVRDEENHKKKKYQVGYVAGVFDLFHVGHLNLFKRAKEQCEYLIVGVVTDEGVMRDKKTMPNVPFEERIELVRSCRYVDEAVEIPLDKYDTYDAYRMYQFDVQFSGSDYENDPAWMAKKAFLQKNGADLVFFPYTQSTSSTKLKAMIEKKLM